MSVKTFEDLEVWQRARVFVKALYQVTQQLARGLDRDFASQIRRAAISIPSNIAEGFERGSNRELANFVYIARGSAGEVRSQLTLAHDLGYLDDEDYRRLRQEILSVSRLLGGLLRYLRSTRMHGERRRIPGEQSRPERGTCNLERPQ